MFYDFLKLYLDNPNLGTPLAVDVIGGDSCLYLVQVRTEWYVIAEEDYMYLDTKPYEVEKSFPVKAKEWCILKAFQNTHGGTNTLPIETFIANSSEASVNMRNGYESVVYSNRSSEGLLANSQCYALLKVEPRDGANANTFNLSYKF